MRRFIVAAGLALTVALHATAAQADAAKSLSKCQKSVAAESAKYVRAVANTVGKCLDKMSTAVVKKGRTPAAAANAAAAGCVAGLSKLQSTGAPSKTLGARFDAKVGTQCDPAANPRLQHVEAETYTVGSRTLGAANLSEYCAALGGDGTLDSFAEWRTCLRAAADREAREAIAVRWPRALEYFEVLVPAIAALPVSNRTDDALAALTDLDAAIEGPIEDNLPDPPSASPGLLATGATRCDPGLGGASLVQCPLGLPAQDGIARAGFVASYRDNGDGTITDLITGLTWEKLSDDGTIHGRDGAYTFAEALTVKIAALNAGGGFAGHTDWRLPNRRELESLVDSGRTESTIGAAFDDNCSSGCSVLDCSCALPEPYWTSTSYQPDASRRWVVDFLRGFVVPSGAATARVRAVRGGVTAPVSGAPGTPSAQPGASLNTCQKIVAGESGKYIAAMTAAVGKCLEAMSSAVIKKGATTAGAAEKSAPACVAALRKLSNDADPDADLGGRFSTKVAAKCDPARNTSLSHLDADTYAIGSRTLSAASLGMYCASLGGDAAIDSFAKWSGCLRRAAEAEARQAIALRWPRALEYFAALRPAIAALPASGKQGDALAVLVALDAGIEGATDDDKPEPPPPPPHGLLATGQTQCAQDDLSIGACPGGLPGQDGAIRAGIARSYTDNGDGTITDNVTGLVWEKLSDDDTIHDRDHEYRPDGLFLNKLARLNHYRFAGHDDWRVPNARELESLVDAGRAAPAIDPIFDHDCTPGCSVLECSCTASTDSVSSTPRYHFLGAPFVPYSMVSVNFADGSVTMGARRMRAVRGGNQPPHIHVNQPPIAMPSDTKHPWKQECIPIALWGGDADSTMLWARMKTFPQNGFVVQFVADPIYPALPDDFWAWAPPDHQGTGLYEMLSFLEDDPEAPEAPNARATILCYVTFSTTFTGTDSFTYELIDNEGAVSNTAIATITVFEI